MSAPCGNEDNPYRSPQTEDELESVASPDPLDPQVVIAFREQIGALGSGWALIGGGMALLAADAVPPAIRSGSMDWVLTILIGFGALWFVCGVLTLFRQMQAVHAGLVLSYLAAIGLFPCSTLVMLPFILQAQRVLRWAKEIEKHRLPLSGSREQRLPPAVAGRSGQARLNRPRRTTHGENR